MGLNGYHAERYREGRRTPIRFVKDFAKLFCMSEEGRANQVAVRRGGCRARRQWAVGKDGQPDGYKLQSHRKLTLPPVEPGKAAFSGCSSMSGCQGRRQAGRSDQARSLWSSLCQRGESSKTREIPAAWRSTS